MPQLTWERAKQASKGWETGGKKGTTKSPKRLRALQRVRSGLLDAVADLGAGGRGGKGKQAILHDCIIRPMRKPRGD